MTALAMDCLNPLLDACQQGRRHYVAAARSVGDPGLRLQFSHIASARATILCDIAAVLGRDAAAEAAQDDPPAETAPAAAGRVVLGGEDHDEGLSPAELCALVTALREQDEHILHQFRQHVDTIPCIATTQVLERAIAVLCEDLEKIRILESLTAGGAAESLRSTAQ
ncbi:hypothetical protein [Caenispirillum bisanense]|uniref:hypothetical protein n=1 Tax=Caenispirillum bisanense TaxID=414052 RepID=UPI0031DD29F1